MIRSFLSKTSRFNRTRSADRTSWRSSVEALKDRKLMTTVAGISAFDGADKFDDTCEVGMIAIAKEGSSEVTVPVGQAEIAPR